VGNEKSTDVIYREVYSYRRVLVVAKDDPSHACPHSSRGLHRPSIQEGIKCAM
jgi:hypothetical protein